MMRRTKIVCTIGPASDSEEMIAKLITAGMNVARLNFSHGTSQYQRELVQKVKRVRKALMKARPVCAATARVAARRSPRPLPMRQ